MYNVNVHGFLASSRGEYKCYRQRVLYAFDFIAAHRTELERIKKMQSMHCHDNQVVEKKNF